MADAADVKNKRIEDGVYEFHYKGQSVRLERRPDLYFDLPLDGVKHKGYLKDLKLKFAQWVDGEAPSEAAPAPEATAARPNVERAAPTKRRGFQTLPVAPPACAKRAYADQWHRKDKKTGKMSYEKGMEVFAKLANGAYDDVYPNVRTAMGQATKEKPLESMYALYWPVVPEEKP